MSKLPPKKKAASKKKRAAKYEPKLKVKGSWIDVINAAVAPDPTPKKKK